MQNQSLNKEVKITRALLSLGLSDGRTLNIWPEDKLAEHILIKIQQDDSVFRLRLSEVKNTDDK